MRNVYAVIFRENKIIVKSKKREDVIEYKFENIKTYPNVPLYANLFQDKIDINEVSKDLNKSFKGDILKNTLILRPKVFVSFPDDATDVDKRAISEFILMLFKANMPKLFEESVLLAPIEELDYVSIYKSCRMFVLTYRKGKLIEAQKFIENKDYTVDEMKGFINNLHDDCLFNKLNIYLNGEGMEKYSILGKVVEKERLLNNLLKVADGKPVRKK
ncbi:hypothetical protein SH2C18_19350 [Clostridium sediminicola]|uniref:hypothetical protein n=1 Tax=Clostridium sediminicola TaxID=3114879 RepID=UPI0031F24C9A